MKKKKEPTMLDIAKKNNAGWSFVDDGKGVTIIGKGNKNGRRVGMADGLKKAKAFLKIKDKKEKK